MAIEILIADDLPMFRITLRRIIDDQEDMTVVAEAENGIEAVKQAARHRPHIILMDVRMPELDGIEATRQVTSMFKDVKIIALSSFAEEIYVQKMMAAGACQYLSKVCDRKDLLDCIRAVSASGTSTYQDPVA